MARVPLSKGKERAKAKIKAAIKSMTSQPGKFSINDFKVRDSSGKPVVTAAPKKAAAPVKKTAPVKKVETKKTAPKKVEVKKVEVKKVAAQKPEVKPNNKDLIDKMTRTGQAYYLDTKTGKLEKNPDVKTITKKAAEAAKNKQTKIVKSKIESLKRPEIRKETIKQEVVVTPRKKSEPTVSQLWQEKTGTSWSEAKKQGLTDGSAAANIALMKKLKSGTVNKESIKAPKPGTAASMDVFKKEMEKNVQSELSGETTYEPPVPAMRRGGSFKKMRKGGITKRRK